MIPILFQDPSLLVCVKSPGLLSQDGPGESLPQRLREQTGSAVYPVHRLDREVGGVMVYARTGLPLRRHGPGGISEGISVRGPGPPGGGPRPLP